MNASWTWVLVGVAAVAVLVLLVIEGRIMMKPDAERSDRERKFLTADRASARGSQWYGRNIAPFIGIASGVLLLVLASVLWSQGKPALVPAVFGVVAVVGMLFLRRFLVRHRGPEWRQQQNDLNKQADAAGRPRWFANTKAGFGLGAAFLLFGIGSLVLDLAGKHHSVSWSGLALLACGLAVLILAAIQRRAEHRNP